MKTIKEHIKKNEFLNLYLLYGTEDYLRKQLKDEMIKAIAGDKSSMNYSYYNGKIENAQEVIEMVDTMPFFAEKRLVICEETSLFKNPPDSFFEKIKNIPETTVLVFVEKEVDKRGRCYKLCQKQGYAANLETPSEKSLYVWIASILKKENKKITADTAAYLVSRVGMNMSLIHSEMEKLISYAWEREVITKDDIDAVCTVSVENRIFDMIDAACRQDRKKAFSLYDDLISLKEAPIKIMVLIVRQFRILLIIKSMSAVGKERGEIAKSAGTPPFVISKNMSVAQNLSEEKIKKILFLAGELEEDIKTGRIKDAMAVEILLTACLEKENVKETKSY